MEKPRLSLNAALWIAAVPVALAGARVLMFSRGDTALLRVLLETLQIVPVLMATTLQLLPWAYFIVGAILLMNRSVRIAVRSWLGRVHYLFPVVFFVGILVLFTSAWGWAITIAAVYLAIATVVIFEKLDKPWSRRVAGWANVLDNKDPWAAVLSIALLPLFVSMLPSWSTFWLPREEVSVGAEMYDGYVLGFVGEWTTILTSEHEVVRVRSEDVTDRIVCDQGEVRTLQNLTLSRPDPDLTCEG